MCALFVAPFIILAGLIIVCAYSASIPWRLFKDSRRKRHPLCLKCAQDDRDELFRVIYQAQRDTPYKCASCGSLTALTESV